MSFNQGTDDDALFGETYPLPPVGTEPSLLPSTREDTLDEPVSKTFLRDILLVLEKISYVIFPRTGKNILKNWDLWGPLFLCLTLAGMRSIDAKTDQSAIVFSGVFVIIWCGAGLVTVNSRLLGGKISFLQSVCVLGYCIFPLTLAEVVTFFIPDPIYFVKIIIVSVCFVWSTFASLTFLTDMRLDNRKLLAVYPIVLFYFSIAWIILIS